MRKILAALVLLALAPAALRADSNSMQSGDSMPSYSAAEPSAPVVSAANLLTSERFWPYQVALTRSWQAKAGKPLLPAGSLGVLIRVEPSGARLDFGRDGLFAVPVSATDLVIRANQIRTGAVTKVAANFTFALGPRLMDSTRDALRRLPLAASADRAGFLCVFADPNAASFPALAASLAPLEGRNGVMTVFFPQGEHPDFEVHAKLRAASWRTAFVLDHLSEAYTRTLLDGAMPQPTLALLTPDGSVLWTGPFASEIPPALTSAWQRAFASKP